MSDTLPSLRPLIADILVDAAPPAFDDAEMEIPAAWHAAQTLAWCDEFELKGVGSREELAAEVEELRAQLDEILELVDDDSLTGAKFRREVAATFS